MKRVPASEQPTERAYRGKSRHRPRNASHLYGGIYPLIQTGDIQKANFYLNEYSQTYSEAGLAQSKLWKSGTMVISIVGANTAETAILGFDSCFPDSVIGFVADTEKADVKFVKYFIESLKGHLKSISEGTARENLSLEKLLSFKIPAPPIATQRKIAFILSAYDDLIENNLKRIKLLEEKAFLSYKGILRSEKLEKISVYNYAEILSGGTPSTTNHNFWQGEIPFFTPKDLSYQSEFYLNDTERKLTELGLEKCNSKLFPRNTIFITARGTVGKLVLAKIPSAISQSNYAITTRNGSSNFFLFLALRDKINYFKQLAVGGVFDTIIVDTFKMIFIEVPSQAIVNQFDIDILPLFNLIDVIQKQNTKLREARDILLPRLMSGEIVV